MNLFDETVVRYNLKMKTIPVLVLLILISTPALTEIVKENITKKFDTNPNINPNIYYWLTS